jgi:aldose 1-epimerase
MEIRVTDFGATLTYVSVPDKRGVFEDVVLGFDSINRYLAGHPMFGSVIGRYANRIGGAGFTLNGVKYNLAKNSGINSIHGGRMGFDKKIFHIDTLVSGVDSAAVKFSCFSSDMEEGYPGNLKLTVTYVLTAKNEIKIRYEAVTDKPTVVNFTNHSYFNLNACKANVLNHELLMYADSITPTDQTLIPTGKLEPVNGTPYDFTFCHKIGDRISEIRNGYDMNYKLRKKDKELSLAAEVYEPNSGRVMKVYTTEPGVQLYTANYLSGIKGIHEVSYQRHFGLCFEAQHFPDSPNKPQFPNVILNPGDVYRQLTVYRFTTK